MTRTFCTVIRDADAEAVLGPWAWHMASLRHWAFKQRYVLGRPVKDVKRDAIARFGVSARQFNGVRFDLDQAVTAWRGQVEHRVKDLAEQVKHAGKAVSRLERKLRAERRKTDPSRREIRNVKFRLHQKKRRQATVQARLDAARAEARRSVPKICFGGRGMLRRGETAAWREKRNRMITPVGLKDETAGNRTARWDGENLTVRLPDALGGGFGTLRGVQFRYGQAEMLAALARGAGITWRLYRRDDGAWQANATIEEAAPAVTATQQGGCDRVGPERGSSSRNRGGPVRQCHQPLDRAVPNGRYGHEPSRGDDRRCGEADRRRGVDPRQGRGVREPGLSAEKGGFAQRREAARPAPEGVRLHAVLRPADRPLRAPRGGTACGESGVFVDDRWRRNTPGA